MNLNANQRPAVVNEIASQIVPSALLLFDGLKEAYKSKAENENASDDEEEEETDDEEDGDVLDLDDDEDHVAGEEFFRRMAVEIHEKCPFPVTSASIMDSDDKESDIDSDSETDDFELTALESYTTTIDDDDSPDDEYVIFKELLERIQQTDPNWYNILVSQLNSQQLKSVQDIYTLASQRKAAAGEFSIDFYSIDFLYICINFCFQMKY